jgi:hypothetical protein
MPSITVQILGDIDVAAITTCWMNERTQHGLDSLKGDALVTQYDQ